jgi:hypothetical protein
VRCLLGSRECFARIGEGDEEAVALRVDLYAAVPREGRSGEPSLIRLGLRVPVAERMQEPGRALDAGEEKGDAAHRRWDMRGGCESKPVGSVLQEQRRV